MSWSRAVRKIDRENLEALLDRLDADRHEAGKKYVELREKLIYLYAWRGCDFPEELADEAMDRVGAKLQQGLEIQAPDPFRYIKGVAHLVFKETLRERKRRQKILEHEAWRENARQRREIEDGGWRSSAGSSLQEARLACLAKCLEGRSPEDRRLIVRYHRGEKRARIENRKQMAAELGIQLNVLRVRASRIRLKLESCARKCLADAGDV